MTIIHHMMKKIDHDVSNLKQGLQPQNLSFWYDKIIKENNRYGTTLASG